MNALRLMSVLALLLTLLPWRAQAAEADDFVAASRSQQAQLLTQWAAAPQADRLPLLRALTTESLVMDDGKHAFRTRLGGLQPLGAVAAPQGETRPVRLTNRLRNLAAGALASHLILSDNVTERASAARTLQREATPAMAALLQQRLQAETDDNVRGLLEVALARLQLTQPEASARLAAVTLLGHSADPETQALLIPFTDAQHEPDAAVREAASDSLQKIKHRLLLGDLLGQLPGRSHDNGLRGLEGGVDVLRHRDAEGTGLTGAGGCLGDDIMPGQHEGDGLFLNLGHFGKAHAFHSLVDGFAALQLAVKHLDNSVLCGVFFSLQQV